MADKNLQDQKLWLTLFQIQALQKRLNLLTVQYWLFSTLAILIAVAALVYFSALATQPLIFLGLGLVVLTLGGTAIIRVLRTGWRRWANLPRAAMIADRRAGLKGRLLTILSIADTPDHSPLWPYLIEDTYGFRREFEPAQIEPQWFSRAILPLLGVCLAVLAIASLLSYRRPSTRTAGVAVPGDVTADINDLEIQPVDPALKPNARLYADAATSRQLQSKLAAARNQPQNKNPVSRWMSSARNFAGALQDKVTGRKPLSLPPLRLKLTNKRNDDSWSQPGESNAPSSLAGTNGNSSASGPDNGSDDGQQHGSTPRQSDQLANNDLGSQPQDPLKGKENPQSSGQNANNPGNGFGGVTGSTHANGTDPLHLFGPPIAQELGSNSFKITIDATPADESSVHGAPAYIPPKIQVSLNPVQAPDEPMTRASIPPEDQLTIKRVFQR